MLILVSAIADPVLLVMVVNNCFAGAPEIVMVGFVMEPQVSTRVFVGVGTRVFVGTDVRVSVEIGVGVRVSVEVGTGVEVLVQQQMRV